MNDRDRSPRASRIAEILERDGWRCIVPACTARRNLLVHPLASPSVGGADEPSNLVTLCVFHRRAQRRGTVRITGEAPDRLRFELGVRPDGPPLAVYVSGDIRVSD